MLEHKQTILKALEFVKANDTWLGGPVPREKARLRAALAWVNSWDNQPVQTTPTAVQAPDDVYEAIRALLDVAYRLDATGTFYARLTVIDWMDEQAVAKREPL